MSRRKRLAQAAGVAGLGLIGLLTAGRLAFFLPPDTLEVAVQASGTPVPLRPGDTVRILIWNVQYGAGRDRHFFYDGGEDVHVPPDEVERTLASIAEVIRKVDPDVVLLQEVDRGSARTGKVDQYSDLLKRVSYSNASATPYHKVPYVPHPTGNHLGRVDMNLAVFSKHAIVKSTRYQLPLLDEPAHRQLFNLRRALMEVVLPIEGGGELRLYNTHLSAFSRGDGTLGKQVAVLAEHADKAAAAGVPWVLAGDLNALPPGDNPSRLLEKDRALYREETTPIQPLYDRFTPAMTVEAYHAAPEDWRSYIAFGQDAPDRTLDYAFHGGVTQLNHQVLSEVLDVSDHLPLLLEIQLPN
ncbi:MAG: endonuclease/exonuclease/phosphatase family protein [Proteobacteria bacterium]|nr:endonuclease/exonuclease/phosphatase family protein [Pseudomonadota bacterium]